MGIDPGTNYMGYGVLEVCGREVRSVVLGDIDLHRMNDPYEKLRYIFERVGALVDEYRPREVALESPFFGENVQSMLKLGRAQGVAMAAALSRGLQVFEYAPTRIKQCITGRGSAPKAVSYTHLNFVIFELLNSTYSFKGDVSDALVRALEQNSGTGKRFYSKSHVAYIDRGRIMVTPIPADDPCQVQVEAGAPRCYCGNSVLYFELRDIDDIQSFGVPEHIAQVDADKLKNPLTVRRWQEGDWFIPYGMSGRKKVSDYLIDHKVPLPEKARQFVLLSGDEIVWLVGRRIDDRYRLTAETENVLRITKEII